MSKDDSGKTPARQSKLVASFKTPQAEQVLDPEDNVDCMVEEKSLGERLGDDSLSMVKTPVARPTFPRFKTCNDFTEGSPALLKSADRDAAITGGRTLMARGSGVADDGDGSPVSVESTRRILQEVQERQDQENKEQVEEVKMQVKKTKKISKIGANFPRQNTCFSETIPQADMERQLNMCNGAGRRPTS